MAEPIHPLADYWVHDLSPYLIRIWHSVGIRWYGLAYLAALVLGGLLVRRWIRQGRVPLRLNELQDFVLIVGLCMIVGGRLGYCFFYAGDTVLHDPLYIIRVWEGGMASHGGIVGLFAGAWLYARRHKRDLLVLCDTICAAAPFGPIFGRIANFINGELWGRKIASHVPWAVIFPTEIPPDVPLKDDEAVRVWQQEHWMQAFPRHPSQLYAAVLEGLIPLLLILPIHARHRKPGLTMGMLLVFYGVGRFIDEFFREPDFGQPIYFGWMTKGQLLTVPLLLVGAGLALWAWRRPARPELYPAPVER
jgi:phosphatidylglycerol---prolipoprotein diacylglyceryl transferase